MRGDPSTRASARDDGTRFLGRVAEAVLEHMRGRHDKEVPVQDIIRPDLLREAIDFDNAEPLGEARLLEVCERILRHSTHTQHPYFVSQLYGCPDRHGLAADLLVSALNTNVHIYDLAPVLTLVERSVIGFLCGRFEMTDGARRGDGIFVPGASTGTQYALHLARHVADPEARARGPAPGGPFVAFCSEAAHYSCVNAAMLLGIGHDNMRKIACDRDGAMRPDALAAAVEASAAAGERPFCVVATAGTTVLGGFDPIDEVAEVARAHDMWLHVDGAWGGAAVLSERHRDLMRGVGRADSVVFNAHKILGMPIQCSALLVHARRGDVLTEANSVHAPYLHQQERVAHEDDLDISKKTFQCGRKGDALKLWLYRQAAGDEGLAERVDRCGRVAEALAAKVAERQERDGAFVLRSSIFATTCFWYVPRAHRGRVAQDGDTGGAFDLGAVAPRIKEHMLAQGYNCMLGYASAHEGPAFFRWAVTNPPEDPGFAERDIDDILDMIEEVGERIYGQGGAADP